VRPIVIINLEEKVGRNDGGDTVVSRTKFGTNLGFLERDPKRLRLRGENWQEKTKCGYGNKGILKLIERKLGGKIKGCDIPRTTRDQEMILTSWADRAKEKSTNRIRVQSLIVFTIKEGSCPWEECRGKESDMK